MYSGNAQAEKPWQSWPRFVQFILFQIAPLLLLGNYLCKFLISSFSKVPGSFISFHIWINCVVPHHSKFVLVEVNTCKLVEASQEKASKGGEEGEEKRKTLIKKQLL